MPRAFRGQNPIIFLTTSQSQYLFFLSFSLFLLLISFMHKISLKLQKIHFFKKLVFTPCKAEQPLQGMELQKKEAQKD